MTRSTLRILHRWIGLLVALPVAIQGLTGALLAVEPWLPEPTLALSGGAPQSASAIIAAAQAAIGTDARVQRYTPSPGSGRAAQVQVGGAGEPARILLIDPVDLDVVGEQGGGFWPWLRSLHVQFLAQAYGGRSIGGWFGIGLVLLLVSGIPIWWPAPGGWRAGFTIPWQARGVRFHRRLHGAVGIWTAAVLLVLAATGVVMAFPRTSRGLMGLEAGGPPRPMRVHGAEASAPDVDRAIALARQAAPEARLRSVVLPAGPGEAMRVFLLHPGAEGAAGSITVQVDPAGTRVVSVQDARQQPPADRAYRWMHDLHEAAGLGPLWRLLAAIAGIALPLFAVTGPTLWWLRRRIRRRLDTARQAALQPGD